MVIWESIQTLSYKEPMRKIGDVSPSRKLNAVAKSLALC